MRGCDFLKCPVCEKVLPSRSHNGQNRIEKIVNIMELSKEGETTAITTTDDDDDESYKQFLAFLASSPSQSHPLPNKQHEKNSKEKQYNETVKQRCSIALRWRCCVKHNCHWLKVKRKVPL